jgi:hypothetical protein
MTKSKCALVAIICLAFAPAALAEDLDSMPPNSGSYGYTNGSQTQQPLWQRGYDAMAQVPRRVGKAHTTGIASPVRPFTANEKALFARASEEIY